MNTYERTEHEQIVAARAKQLGVFYRVLSDPDIIRNTYSHNMYPDIIVIDRRNKVVYVEEVETESSVTESEMNHQWANYSELGYPFNLIVPKSEEMKARKLIKDLNVHKLYYYELTSFGIKFRQVII